MAIIAKLFRSPRERKTVGRQKIVIKISQETTSGKGMSLDAVGKQAEMLTTFSLNASSTMCLKKSSHL